MAWLEKSGNPALNEKTFQQTIPISDGSGMTVTGTLNKFGIMFLLLLASASFVWKAAAEGKSIGGWILAGAIGGLIVVIIAAFKPQWSSFLAPVYALLEGAFVGGISAYYNDAFAKVAPNIVMQAVGLTFGVVIAMYALYHFRVIKVTQKLRSIIFMATAGIAIFYLLSFVLGMFGIQMPLIHENTSWGILFSLLVVGIASLNLLLDFDMIERGAAMGAPKYMEWYGSLGLMVTIVWLYIEILRLLSKLSSRN
ncbi:MAG TPA: Bax inhibitor-1/YccA family protein [Flavitalea sp.]|nr:Bax inhibitor-1/YccA family protein [Flavitalea sp.]